MTRVPKDPVAMAVLAERLVAITEDIGHVLIRGAFSSNIKERRDCSTGLFDHQGRLIAQADHMPIHIGSLLWGVRALLAKYDRAEIHDGDVFVCNDPYLAGGTHLPDIAILTPVFLDRELRFFTGSIAHHADVGGPVPGSVSGQSRSIFAEGIRLPLIRIVRQGEIDHDLLQLISREHPRSGPSRSRSARPDRRQRPRRGSGPAPGRRHRSWPNSRARSTTCSTIPAAAWRWRSMPYPTAPGRRPATSTTMASAASRYRSAVRVEIEGERLTFDLTGSGPEAKGAINLSSSSLEATLAYCVKALLDPALPANSGLLDGFEVQAPPSSVVNPSPPAALAARAVTANRLAGAVFDALGQALPDHRRMAASNDSTSLIAISGHDPRTGRTYVYPESMGGGGGAFPDADGADAIHVHTINPTNLPVEALENEYPLRCEHAGLVPDSGGAGRHRGGLGIARAIRILQPGTTLTIRSDGHHFPAPGAAGGKPGSTTRIRLNPGTERERDLASKTTLEPAAGDLILIETLGGGGFGPPEERAIEAIATDLAGGKVTLEGARADYGPTLVERARSQVERLRRLP